MATEHKPFTIETAPTPVLENYRKMLADHLERNLSNRERVRTRILLRATEMTLDERTDTE